MQTWAEIRRRVLSGELSLRQAARAYRLNFRTVHKIVHHQEPPAFHRGRPRPKPVLDPFLPIIHRILEEQLFLNLTTVLRCELNTLPYPKAALFGFCVALAAGNLLGTAKGSLRAAHGAEAVEEVSDWRHLGEPPLEAFAQWLLGLARRVSLRRFRKQQAAPRPQEAAPPTHTLRQEETYCYFTTSEREL
jgi:hypothetical protein